MSALPRPDVPPGPHRDLVVALHALHHRAGWPSLRTLARETGVSHTTVSKVFSSPALPSWGALELVVEALDGDTSAFHDLWLAATAPPEAPTAPRIAGRRAELAAVRRHLEAGTGLLLVTGEAGIGKTTLVSAAGRTADAFVSVGHCLPLSTEVPLMPVAEALGRLLDADEGLWMKEALADCPPFVRAALASLLPELVEGGDEPATDDHARHRMFTAAARLIEALAAARPMALLLEDLHWADAATLDLVETSLARGTGVPILGTWRTEDRTTLDRANEWLTRVRRTPGFRQLPLKPLSRDETGDQLALLTGQAPGSVFIDAIHRRTQGQPLFTEHLVAHSDGERQLPDLLADLLDARLGDLSGPAWAAARALGVADRPLARSLLAQIAGLADTDLTAGLHDLDARQLLGRSSHQAALRHPLLAEAIRRRLVVGEVEDLHGSVASALASTSDAEPAEVARHWQSAGNRVQELQWRIRAAGVAHERFALQQEADEWLRVLELWPGADESAGEPAIRRYEALVSLLTLWVGIEAERADALAADCLALATALPPTEAAQMLFLAGDHYADAGQRELGLDLLTRANAILDDCPASEEHVLAIKGLESALRGAGRNREAAAAAARAVEVSAELGDPGWHRVMLMKQAWHDVRQGRVSEGMALASQAVGAGVDGPDPRREAALLADYTDLLLHTAGDVDELVSVGKQGLDAAAVWELASFGVLAIRYNMAQAMRRAGRVHGAAALIEPYTEEMPPRDRWGLLHLERARLDMLQGRPEAARSLVDTLRATPVFALDELLDVAEALVDVDVWTGRQEFAFEHVVALSDQVAPTEAARYMAPALALAARAAADGPVSARKARLQRLVEVHEACLIDPFAMSPVPADNMAWTATWTAEMARLAGTATVDHWIHAATSWDRITRPHDAAYCRWRAAQVALRDGQGTIAVRLLKRAAADAREHVPLSEAIAATAAGAR